MNRLKILVAAFLPAVASLAIQLIVMFWVSLIFAFVLVLGGAATMNQIQSPEYYALLLLTSPLFYDICLLSTAIVVTGFFLVWYRKQNEKPQRVQGKIVFCPRNLLIILVSGLCIQICISLFLTVLLPLFPKLEAHYEALINAMLGGNPIVALFSSILLLPIAEEIIFRELMTKKLCKLFPFWAANIIQALVFAIYHMNPIQGVYAFIIGLLFGYVAYRMQSVFASVLLHVVINGASQLLEYILPTSLFESIFGMVILAVITGMIVILLTFLYRFPSPVVPAAIDDGALLQMPLSKVTSDTASPEAEDTEDTASSTE